MRIARFSYQGDVSYGLVMSASANVAEGPVPSSELTPPGTDEPAGSQPAGPPGDPAGGNPSEAETEPLIVAPFTGHPFGPSEDIRLTGTAYPLDEVRLLAPILPSKIIGIGKNYADHAREMGSEPPAEPVIFLKPSTAVCGPGDTINAPTRLSDRVDFEGELAVVIGRLCRDVPARRVPEVIFGYTCGNDVTARDLQARDGQWSRAKGFDTFCPLGPWIATDLDVSDVGLTTTVNGEVKQAARTSLLLHNIADLIVYVSQVMTLLPGDVLLTGTPAGVGPLKGGDEVSVRIDGIGTLTNPVLEQD